MSKGIAAMKTRTFALVEIDEDADQILHVFPQQTDTDRENWRLNHSGKKKFIAFGGQLERTAHQVLYLDEGIHHPCGLVPEIDCE
jgi:hypothetical protein